jgi:5-methylcytosine-specific restriction endonuclease McrA
MTSLATQEYAYNNTRWSKTRLLVLARDRYECRRCGLNFPKFDIHHMKERGDAASHFDLDNLVTLDRNCHRKVEAAVLWHNKKMKHIFGWDSWVFGRQSKYHSFVTEEKEK